MKASGERGLVSALAPAKVNPYLAVRGRRDDGYHEVETTLLAINLCDRLDLRVLSNSSEVTLTLRGSAASADVPADQSNLALRAASAVLAWARAQGAADASTSLAIELEKRIPSQAGLGGGSSDAAAAMLASQVALGIELPAPVAHRALAELGSDCAFFFEAADTGYALATGRGERIRSLPVPARAWSLALVTPEVVAPTASVYREYASRLSVRDLAPTLAPNLLELSAEDARRALFNGLERAALCAVPALRRWREFLDRCGLDHFRLSGSGSSFFGLFETNAEATEALARFSSQARSAGLHSRGEWVLSAAGHGARIVG